jgi:CelD/BcsL family acetyltransferase involved in cellulose biosynthesis
MEILLSHMVAIIELTAWPGIACYRDLWEDFRSQSGLLHPFFSPCWIDAVQDVYGNVEVLVFRKGGDICGFLPFQRTGWKTAGPAGGHFVDYQGVIGTGLPLLSPSEILATARLEALELDHTVPHAIAWDPSGWIPSFSPAIRLVEGFPTLTEFWRQRGSAWDTLARKERKLIREKGPWTFTPHLNDPVLLDQLITWKRLQYRTTGVRDVLATTSDRRLLHRLLQPSIDSRSWEARLSVLRCGNQPIALHLGLYEHGIWHYWLPAYDPSWAAYSPGLLLLREMVRHGCDNHGDLFDLGKGSSRYKTDWANTSVPLLEGRLEVGGWVATRRSLSGWLRRAARAAGASRLKSAWVHLRSNVRG